MTPNLHLPYKFSHARTALKYGLMSYHIKAGSEILLPEYICDVILQPLDQLKLKPIYYKINEQLEPDWIDVKKKTTSRTLAIVMVHYFGIPQDIDRFLAFSRKHKILLIEDNAHGFGGRYKGRLLGTWGDIGIVSLWKVFPILNGAYLYLKKKSIDLNISLTTEPKNIIFYQIKEVIKNIVKSSDLLRRLILKRLSYENIHGFREGVISDRGMDEYSYIFVMNYNISSMIKIRQRLYSIWEKWALRKGLSLVFHKKIGSNCSPLVFPAYTRNKEENKEWFKWGFYNGIDIHSWPTLPEEIIRKRMDACKIWEKLICFPIHQGMIPEHLEKKLQGWE